MSSISYKDAWKHHKISFRQYYLSTSFNKTQAARHVLYRWLRRHVPNGILVKVEKLKAIETRIGWGLALVTDIVSLGNGFYESIHESNQKQIQKQIVAHNELGQIEILSKQLRRRLKTCR